MSSIRSAGEGGLVWAIGASGVAHGVALALLALTPSRFEGMATPPESYNVSLVAPSVVGGTHLPGSPDNRPEAPPRVDPPKPSRPTEREAATEPKVIPKPQADSAPEQAPKVAESGPKPPPPEELPKAAKSVQEPEAKVAEVAAVEKPKPPSEPGLDVRSKPAEKEKAAPQPEGPPRKVEKQAPAKKEVEAEKKQPPRAQESAKKAETKPTTRDDQIAAAIQRRLDAASADPSSKQNETAAIDRRIAEAVQRRAKEAARAGSGIGSSDSTVASVGPGSGVGGVVRGIEYVMYRNQMESRIKAAWAWAGSDRSLRAVVRFNVTEEGKIINVQTVQPSGDASYDASVERAIRAADPLAPPPEQYRNEFGTVELEFRAEDARG